MDKDITIMDYSSLFKQILEYINGTIEYPELKYTTAPFGIYKQRNNNFMVRIRITGGEISLQKLSAISKIAKKNSVGFLHLTSRQDIQLHDIEANNIIPIIKECTKNNMPFRGGGGDTLRNVTACYHSGFSENSIFDVIPYARQLTSYLFTYNKAFDNLPRKIKLGFSCCEEDTGLSKLQDLGFIAKIKNGLEGFTVFGGGGMGNQSSVGIELKDFIPGNDAVRYAIAMTDLFNDHGNRTSRSKARIRFILKKLGRDDFKKLFFNYLDKVNLPKNIKSFKTTFPISETVLFDKASTLTTTELSSTELITYSNWKMHAIANTNFNSTVLVKLLIPHGKLQITDFEKIIELMSEVKSPFARLSREENIHIPIKRSDIKYIFSKLNGYMAKVDFTGFSLQGHITSCIGSKTCLIGIIDSHIFSDSIAKALNKLYTDQPELKSDFFSNIVNSIKVSGCPNSCSNHPAFALGFQGIRRKNIEGVPTDYCKVFIGGHPNKLNECIDGLLLDSKQIGIYVYDLVNKYYKIKKEGSMMSFSEAISMISKPLRP